jgi:serine protease Do
VKSPLDWDAELFNLVPGDTVSLTVHDAQGRQRRFSLRVEDLPSVRAERVEALSGLELVTLTPAIRAERGLRNQRGALIVNVSDDVSRVTGLEPGDLIVRINRWTIESADDAARALEQQADEDAVRVYYERSGVIWSTAFRIERS